MLRRRMEEHANYRDLFPVPPAAGAVLNCAEAGVLGVLAGHYRHPASSRSDQTDYRHRATVAINRLLTYNALTNQLFEIAIPAV